MPKWLRETEKFIREPSFLPEDLPPLETPADFSETTVPAVADASVAETEPDDSLEPPKATEDAGTRAIAEPGRS